MTETPPIAERKTRSTLPQTPEFASYMSSGWADHAVPDPQPRAQAPFAAARRAALSRLHPGTRLVVPAGELKARSNDTEYPFRAHSAFAHLTGWGSDTVPGSVLVLEPTGESHSSVLYMRATAGHTSTAFFTDHTVGEFWAGPRPTLSHVASDLQIHTLDRSEFDALAPSWDSPTALITEADAELTRLLGSARGPASDGLDAGLARDVAELRLVKDHYEIEEMRRAVAATAAGFDDVIRDLPRSSTHVRGERLVEGVFQGRARADGNSVGYDTIAAAGQHATVLHWVRNNGPVTPGELLLLDAGVEMDSYYTADITRTLPINGTFSPIQRLVYDAVLDAADAAFAVTRPGVRFRDVHDAAMEVIVERLSTWGLLQMSPSDALKHDNQPHRRYMVHGTSHHLGLDVHDCAKARLELYQDGTLDEGMVFTIEPGLYFQADDLTVPMEYRGIGVRIEDDIVVTADGAVNLSAAIPRTATDVEQWIARLLR